MTEATLPGLETVEPVLPVTERTPWIERGPQKRLMLYAGRSNPELAEQIAEKLGIHLGEVELKTFANGETYVRYLDSIRGADVFIVQSGNQPVNDHLVELLIMIQAAKLASAKRITAVVPWFPYSRQDKKSAPREPITANFAHQPGKPKGKTTIGRNVRTGVHNAFVAPVEIGDDAWIGAGSVITDDVPPESLAVARARQENKDGYVRRQREREE